MSYISTLRLTDFRNYETLDLNLGPQPIILYGANGSGKTNLMEAVSLLTPGRGLRRAALPDIARKGVLEHGGAWAVAAKIVTTDNHLLPIGVGQVPHSPRRRTVRIDGKNASGTDLARLLSVMWLTPAQDRLFTGPSSERRRFLDRFCLAHAPEHGKSSLRYEKARSERNRLLTEHVDDDLWYQALETDMALFGTHIAQARAITVAALKEEIAARPDTVFPKAKLWLDGEAEALFESGADFDDVQGFISTHLQADRRADMRAGRTLRGVHKSDLKVTHSTKDMPAQDCSTGEQKALLIGLILAHARAQAAYKPILLLDEIAAHLDVDRRAALAEELLDLGTQVFMTGTDASLFDAFNGRAQSFLVDEGAVNIDHDFT